jgi:DNA-directed RNA polymerase specialized sigma24 family protein
LKNKFHIEGLLFKIISHKDENIKFIDMRNISRNTWKNISDVQYISGLKKGDNQITESFFYGLCNYSLNNVKYSLMKNVEYDELVSELFIYLSKDNWHKLDTYNRVKDCSLRSWMTRITWRYFFQQKKRLLGRDILSDDGQIFNVLDKGNVGIETAVDIDIVFKRMANKRFAKVLQWFFIDGSDVEDIAVKLDTSKANVYNIKHRAIEQFVAQYDAC